MSALGVGAEPAASNPQCPFVNGGKKFVAWMERSGIQGRRPAQKAAFAWMPPSRLSAASRLEAGAKTSESDESSQGYFHPLIKGDWP